jgi:fumarate hydratase subunit beta
MIKCYDLHLPVSEEDIRSLHIGDTVSISGEIILMAGLPTHQRVIDYIEHNRCLPVQFRNAAILHLPNYMEQTGSDNMIHYVNPTTSTRFNAYTPKLIRHFKLRIIGGKGGLDAECVRAMEQSGCVYIGLPGGGCSLLTPSIKEVTSVHWTDLSSYYRLVTIRVEKMGPGIVAIDSHGNSMYENVRRIAESRLPGILNDLNSNSR